MDSERLLAIVHDTVAQFRYDPPAPGTTIGVPWSAEKVNEYVGKLKVALVKPYLQRFQLEETREHLSSHEPVFADYWVVVEGGGGYLEWYDPVTGEFGLGQRREHDPVPISFGLRGDLVGVFCSM